jgi:predicted transcriptional regulator
MESKLITFRIEDDLKKAAIDLAKAERRSLSAWIAAMIADRVAAQTTKGTGKSAA